MKRFGKLGLALLISSPGAAMAADLPARTAPPVFAAVPLSTWEGFYAGSFISAQSTRFESRQIASVGVTKGGYSTGLLAGYNWQSGPYVFGLEGDIAQDDVNANNAGAIGLVPHSSQSLHSVHLRGRLGYDMGAFLPFVAGGATYHESAVSVPVVGGDVQGANKTGTGWNVGAGVDWKVALPILGDTILRAEYMYERLPSRDYTYNPALASIGMRSSSHQIRFAMISTPSIHGWRAPQFDVADWSGDYAGVLAGYGKDRVHTNTAVASQSLDADGGFGGLYGGRNFTFGSIVAGWEGAVMLPSLKGDGVVPGTFDAHSYRDYFNSDLRVRAGYAFGRFLPFLAGGVAFGRSEQSDLATLSHRGKVSTDAWTIGGGVDYMLMERVSARIEYLHQKSWNNSDVNLNGVPMSQTRSSDYVRAGLAWHFH